MLELRLRIRQRWDNIAVSSKAHELLWTAIFVLKYTRLGIGICCKISMKLVVVKKNLFLAFPVALTDFLRNAYGFCMQSLLNVLLSFHIFAYALLQHCRTFERRKVKLQSQILSSSSLPHVCPTDLCDHPTKIKKLMYKEILE